MRLSTPVIILACVAVIGHGETMGAPTNEPAKGYKFTGVFSSEEIVIQMENRTSFTIDIRPEDSVNDLLFRIQSNEGYPYARQRLLLANSSELLADKTELLSKHNIRSGSAALTLVLAPSNWPTRADLFLITLDGERVALMDVDLTQTVASLKESLRQFEGLPRHDRRLLFAGKELRDERPLLEYTISRKKTLHQGRPLAACGGGGPSSRLLVRTLGGKVASVELDLTERVAKLRERIQQQVGVAREIQALAFEGLELNDCDRLCDYGLVNGSSVLMALHSRLVRGPEQVDQLVDPLEAHPARSPVTASDPHRAPVLRESISEAPASSAATGVFKDARNWMFAPPEPKNIMELFDPVAHLDPCPHMDLGPTIELLSIKTYGTDEYRDIRARLRMATVLKPHRAKLPFSADRRRTWPGIDAGAGWLAGEPLSADVNNYAPDGLSDHEIEQLFEQFERVRAQLESDARTNSGVMGVAELRNINREILHRYIASLSVDPPVVPVEPLGDQLDCGICRDELASEPAVTLSCGHSFHTDCIEHWLPYRQRLNNRPTCPYCRQISS